MNARGASAGFRILVDAGPTENTHRKRGIGTVAREVLRAIDVNMVDSLGVQVDYLRRSPLADMAIGSGLGRWVPRSRSADWTGVAPGASPLLANWWQTLDAAGPMSREVARAGHEVILALDPHAIPLGRGYRTVAVLYDVVPLVFPAQYFRGRMGWARRALYTHRLGRMRRAQHVVAISEASRDDAVRLAGFHPACVSVAPLAVDHAAFSREAAVGGRDAMRRALGLDAPYFLYVGECDARKNVPCLLAAFLLLAADHPRVELVMAGASMASAATMRAHIAGRPGAERVRWLGHVTSEHLPALFGDALAFVFPSRYEGFGLPVLEAMSCGAPVITSRLSSLPEVAGDAALYADVGAAAPIADAMRHLIREPSLRRELAACGLRRAAGFTWARTARLLLEACAALR